MTVHKRFTDFRVLAGNCCRVFLGTAITPCIGHTRSMQQTRYHLQYIRSYTFGPRATLTRMTCHRNGAKAEYGLQWLNGMVWHGQDSHQGGAHV